MTAKPLTSITMGKEARRKKKRKKLKEIQACRVLPLRIALLGYEGIIELPLIRRMPDPRYLDYILKKRYELLVELQKSKF